MMEKKQLKQDPGRLAILEKYAKRSGTLISALANASMSLWNSHTEELYREYMKTAGDVHTADMFWNHTLEDACLKLTDAAFTKKLYRLSFIIGEGQFSTSPYRRSYRSKDYRYHVYDALRRISHQIYLYTFAKTTVQILTDNSGWLRGMDDAIALAICQNEDDIRQLLKEAIYGENATVLLSRDMIRGIIISSDQELVEDLGKLLIAARLQEGLRQAILENADAGKTEVLEYFMRLCVEHELFRYSSCIRAFDVWTGLAYDDTNALQVQKYAPLALACLQEEQVRKKTIASDNHLEAYLALWAYGCHEINDTDVLATDMIHKGGHLKFVGWYYVTHTDSLAFRFSIACKYLETEDDEELAWVCLNLPVTRKLLTSGQYTKDHVSNEPVENPLFSENERERAILFDRLLRVVHRISHSERTFRDNPFPGCVIGYTNENVLNCLISLAGYDMDRQRVESLYSLSVMMNVSMKEALISHFIDPSVQSDRIYLRSLLADKSVSVRTRAAQKMMDMDLSEEDVSSLAQSLRSKSSSFRKQILTVLERQSDSQLKPLIEHLLDAGEDYEIQAGLELLGMHREWIPKYTGQLQKLSVTDTSTQTAILLQEILSENTGLRTAENGYGMFEPVVVENFQKASVDNLKAVYKGGGLRKLLFRYMAGDELLKKVIAAGMDIEDLVSKMNTVFERHASFEYAIEEWDGSVRSVLFGNPENNLVAVPKEFGNTARLKNNGALKADMIPFAEEFRVIYNSYVKDGLHGLAYAYRSASQPPSYSRQQTLAWYAPIEKKYEPSVHSTLFNRFGRRYWQILTILQLLYQETDMHERFVQAFAAYREAVGIVGVDRLDKVCSEPTDQRIYSSGGQEIAVNRKLLRALREICINAYGDDTDFKEFFCFQYGLQKTVGGGVQNALPLTAYFRARQLELIPQDVLSDHILLDQGTREYSIRALSAPQKNKEAKQIFDRYDWANAYVKGILRGIAETEVRRGELATALTPVAKASMRYEGGHLFCALLGALAKESFHRGYLYSSNTTKKEVLSQMLKRCYPADTDTPVLLERQLQEYKITQKRLLEAVMYAPQWASLAESVTNINGLKKAVWFFHAHINETFSAEKEAECALYSDISPQEFNEGAFDIHWYREALESIGEKNFQILYRNAKYITSGSNNHRRVQLYTEAVGGKLDPNRLETEILEKRNQERLRAYGLIPVRDHVEVLHRYLFIESFRKEGKRFGIQRRQSERKACDIALRNLALTSGFADVTRLIWKMESLQADAMRTYYEGIDIGSYRMFIQLDDNGEPSLKFQKGEKFLSSVPKNMASDPRVREGKDNVYALRERRSRAVKVLEKAMCERTEFHREELQDLLSDSQLRLLLERLIMIDHETAGFPSYMDGNIYLNWNGQATVINGPLRIAHPHDLRMRGIWHTAMEMLYANSVKQPFKQVFREYYPLMEEEKSERTISRRYAGYQVQPKKTVALLKGRGWTVDYEEGLQKVFTHEDLVVRMYAAADWFSPADIEAPTLETVEFYSCNTGAHMALEEIDPITFSEVMRDIDLVVSTAHAGGVDPESSHSTMEMRREIAIQLTRLLKKDNVRFEETHALIHGQLADYSVHLGSGVVHCLGKGMLAIVTVQSQARGRIFLPFADDDPKTAEVMTKIILLSEDQKIKDPSILRQIR